MLTFVEYVAWRRKKVLPAPVTMLAMLGISPEGPHEVEVMRMVKQVKKATAQAPKQSQAFLATLARLPGIQRPNQSAM